MVAYYAVMGQKVGSHVLAMATLGTTFGVSFLALRGGSKKDVTPPIQAQSTDEENFIKEFLAKSEAETQKR